jgi:hypothetical protein
VPVSVPGRRSEPSCVAGPTVSRSSGLGVEVEDALEISEQTEV